MRFVVLGIILLVTIAFSRSLKTEGNKIQNVNPSYLDKLLNEGRYEEFEHLMKIPVPNLSKPNREPPDNPMFNPALPHGDILYTSEELEEGRQGVNFENNPNQKWQDYYVPYAISNSFTPNTKKLIEDAVQNWNTQISCIKYQPRNNEEDYALFFPGDGCYANAGKRGGQQPISIGRGCERTGIILHEMDHTIGFAHEHNRSDRDDFVTVLYRNIPPNWWSQYQKTNSRNYGLQSDYDYYSILHYPYRASTGLPAFRILKNGIDTSRMGQRDDFTDTDREKICLLYKKD